MSLRNHRCDIPTLPPNLRLTTVVASLILIFAPALSTAEDSEFAPPGRIVHIGTTRLHVYCEGEGSPTVVVDTGLGEPALEWFAVQQRLRHYTRVCLYDRAGYGWSDFGELPRSSSRIVNELYALLRRADVRGPYVLVGHSYGGMNMQLFARRYPYLVAGLVLVDSSNAEQIDRMQVPLLRSMDGIRATYQGGVATTDFVARPVAPAGLEEGPALLGLLMMSRTYTMRTVANEYLNFKASARQVGRNAGHLPDVPLVVLSRGPGPSQEKIDWSDANEDAWSSLQMALANAVPRSAHIVAERSGHSIHMEQPELVADAVSMVLDFARAEDAERSGTLSDAEGRATTWLPFAGGIWLSDRLHTTVDVCPFGCDDHWLAHVIRRSGHVAGTGRPSWQRVTYAEQPRTTEDPPIAGSVP
ncbi:MAG: alpha/beta fold hydrolase [Chromatiales bacterium]